MGEPGGQAPLFDFTVPDELLVEAVSQSRDREAVADLELVPGTGTGKPPRLRGVLQKYGVAPLVLLTLAALIPGTFSNAIGTLAPDIQRSFHLSDTGLGAVAFVGGGGADRVGPARSPCGPTAAAARSSPRSRC